ncbi:MAG: 2-polyprenylphenol 6-hydroxylase [Hyphomicrobiales bacterium]|nr:2-polyprenylphenol 6-hydroxylase [Hyphomicrobiales bacterium]MDE2016092.1 2-polyprenylphenol 6-hydroxylase [Hyphomicrobiales bacterium]
MGHAARLARALWALAREGVFLAIDPAAAPPAARVPLALTRALARKRAGLSGLAPAMTRLGPSYVKLGQFLATRQDVVGAKVAAELEKLQDRVPPFPREVAARRVEDSLGRPLGELYESFGEPVAAASVAQVHRARVRDADGVRDVAVKVLRPGVERRFRRDLDDMRFAARFAEAWFPAARRLRPVETVETLARSVRREMDLRLEAAAASEFRENAEKDAEFRVPSVDWERTSRDALTLEWIDGAAMSDDAALDAAGHDRPRLARLVIQSFLRHALRDGLFHADMHRGNLFVDPQGRLAAVDFGIMDRIGDKERRFLAEILYGFIVRDYRRVAEVHFEAGYVPRTHSVEDFAQAIRAVGEPIHARTADQISMARVLTLLFEITSLFDMSTRTELVLLQKTMVVVEGVARGLDPKLDMWATAEPVVRDYIEGHLGPSGIARRALGDLGKAAALLSRAPGIVERLFDGIENPPPAQPPARTFAVWRWIAVAVLVYAAYRYGLAHPG